MSVADFLEAILEKLRRTAEAAEAEANTASVDIYQAGTTIEDAAQRWRKAISSLEDTGRAIEALLAVERLTDANRAALRSVLADVRASTASLGRLLQEEIARVRDRVGAIETDPDDTNSAEDDRSRPEP